ncbi:MULTISPECIES: MFS transporter [unclassified Microbacterium]|uniref:MFS transporter n=1 Tax=unclassified Microbacterium TaxID=2609290 RepID=UPI00301B0729
MTRSDTEDSDVMHRVAHAIKAPFLTDKAAGRVGLHRALGWGSVDMFVAGTSGFIGGSLLFFYTTFAGIDPLMAAFIIVTGRLIIDAVASPLMGRISDLFARTKLGKRFGRRRFFLLVGAPLSLSYILLWVTGASPLYYIVTLVVFELIFTMIVIPWETLPTDMTNDYVQRTKMGTFRMWIAAVSSSLTTIIPAWLMTQLGPDDPATYLYTGILYGAFGAVILLIAFFSTWEQPLDEIAMQKLDEEAKLSPFQGIVATFAAVGTTLRIKTFRKHLVLYFATYGAIDAFNTIFLYFATYSLIAAGQTTTDGYILLSLSIVGWFLAPFLGGLFIRFGARPLYIVGVSTGLIAMIAYGVLYLTQDAIPHNAIMTVLVAVSIVFQLGRSVIGFLPWNVYPFIPDLDEIISKEKRAGIFAGVMTFYRKASAVVITVLVGVVLQIGGLRTEKIDGKLPTPEQQPDTVAGYVAGLLVFLIGGLFVLLLWNAITFRLNRQNHALIISEIERLRAGGSKADVTVEARDAMELLTGKNYDQWAWTGR